MKHVDFEYNGRTLALSFTADALFRAYDRFGVCDDIIEQSRCFEPSAEGWQNCCWLAALMAEQGELQRRHMGRGPVPIPTAEELGANIRAADSIKLMRAVRRALELGFSSDVPADEGSGEVNEVLLEREKAEKKALPDFAVRIWQRLVGVSD